MDALKFLKDQVVENERRIKKIDEKPDPFKLKSNRIYYECQREARLRDIAAWENGEPCTMYPGAGLGDLFRSMGVNLFDHGVVSFKLAVSDPELMKKVRQTLLSSGYSYDQCDLATYPIGYSLMGMCPPFKFIVRSHSSCQAFGDTNVAVAKLFNLPIFYLDTPLDTSDESIDYTTKQLRELVSWIEKIVPTAHYSDERLEEWLDANERWSGYLHRIWETKKYKPCPMTARDGFREIQPLAFYPEEVREKAVQYVQTWADEIEDRVATGKQLPEEKARVTWTATGPLLDIEIFNLLETKGITIPAYVSGGAPNDYRYAEQYDLYSNPGGKLSPLERVAKIHCGVWWNGLANKWLDAVILASQQQDTDGVIYFLPRGCPQVTGLMGLAAERVEKELGRPCLLFKGSMFDFETYDKAESLSRMNDFIELMIAQKAAR